MLGLISLLGLACWIYRPYAARPFDLIDFPDTLPILLNNGTFGSRMEAFTRQYLLQGRYNPVAYASIAGQWAMFQWWTPGWQVTRFAMMSAILLLSCLLMLRLGISRVAALAASSVFVISPAAARGFTKLTSAEPTGTIFLLVGCWIAMRIHPTSRTRGRLASALLVGSCLVAAVLTKEMLVAAFLLPYLLRGSLRHGVSLRHAFRDRDLMFMTLIGTIMVAAALLPVASAYLHAPPSSYATRFGSAGLSLLSIFGSLILSTVPFIPVGTQAPLPLLVAVFTFAALLALGLPAFKRGEGASFISSNILTVAMVLPLLGALAYAPWPNYSFVYSLPFLFGGALLLAAALHGVQSLPIGYRFAGWCAYAFILCVGASQAMDEARRMEAVQVAVGKLVPLVAESGSLDSVLVAQSSASIAAPGSFAKRLKDFGAVLGHPWPAVRDVSCEEASARSSSVGGSSGILVVRFSLMCPSFGSPVDSIRLHFRHLDWATIDIGTDSVRIDVLRGAPR